VVELSGLLAGLEQGPVGTTVREGAWNYPVVEIAHILGFAVLVGATALFDLRLLGVSGRLIPVSAVARHALPWALFGFGIAVASGLLLFSANATALASNPAFRLKALLIVLAGLNAFAFHYGPYRRVGGWDQGKTPAEAKVVAVVSLALWAAIVACGRLIAYVGG